MPSALTPGVSGPHVSTGWMPWRGDAGLGSGRGTREGCFDMTPQVWFWKLRRRRRGQGWGGNYGACGALSQKVSPGGLRATRSRAGEDNARAAWGPSSSVPVWNFSQRMGFLGIQADGPGL